jgi:hypothetical protein
MLAFAGVQERGFEGWSEAYRRWMPDGRTAQIDEGGNLRIEGGSVVELAPALAPVAWLDPQTGTPRL